VKSTMDSTDQVIFYLLSGILQVQCFKNVRPRPDFLRYNILSLASQFTFSSLFLKEDYFGLDKINRATQHKSKFPIKIWQNVKRWETFVCDYFTQRAIMKNTQSVWANLTC